MIRRTIRKDDFPDNITEGDALEARQELERICDLSPEDAPGERDLIPSLGHTVVEATWPYMKEVQVGPDSVFLSFENGSRVPSMRMARLVEGDSVEINPSRASGLVYLFVNTTGDTGPPDFNAILPFREVAPADAAAWHISDRRTSPGRLWRPTEGIEELLSPVQEVAKIVLDAVTIGEDNPDGYR